jgi:hypothetical protein
MKKSRPRLTYANVVASLALFLALCGGAVAATHLPKNSVGSAQLKKGAVTGAKVKKGSLLASSFKGGQLPRGPQGEAGKQGPAGPAGPVGPAGSPWTAGGTLPSGATLKGTYALIDTATSVSQRFGTGISFAIPLATAPAQHIIRIGAPAPSGCPGSAASPQASPGNLCVYEARNTNVSATLENPVNGETGADLSQPFGFEVVGRAGAAAPIEDTGTWAVTAP